MKKENRQIVEALALVIQFGIYMLVPIFLCTFIGIWIGRRFDILWIVIPLFFLGAIAGFTNIYKMSKKFWDKDSSKGKKDVKKD